MGLFSSIKKGLSKAWKGVKKAVKQVAKGVKKVAKGIVTSMPGGQKLWKEGGRLGKKIMKGIGKITSKLGPIGTMALSFVLAPVMGPMLSSLWSSFGAGAASMAASANAFVSTLGTVGQGIFAAGNWVGGTLGAMGNALTEGASNVMAGDFSGAVTSFASNMSNALTGKAGMAAVHAGTANAAATAASELAAQGGSAAQVNALTEQATNAVSELAAMGEAGTSGMLSLDTNTLDIASPQTQEMARSAAAQFNPVSLEDQAAKAIQFDTGVNPDLMGPDLNVSNQFTADAMKQQMVTSSSDAFTTSLLDGGSVASGNGLQKAKDAYDQVSGMLGGGAQEDGSNPYMTRMPRAKAIQSASGVSGQGSAGFSLLGGVQGLEESLRNSQRLMFS